MKGVVSLLSFSVHLSFVYRKATGFFVCLFVLFCFFSENISQLEECLVEFWGHLFILLYHLQIMIL